MVEISDKYLIVIEINILTLSCKVSDNLNPDQQVFTASPCQSR